MKKASPHFIKSLCVRFNHSHTMVAMVL